MALIAIGAVAALCLAVIAVALAWWKWHVNPLVATLRASLALLTTLVGSLFLPSSEMVASLSLDLGIFSGSAETVRISTATSSVDLGIAFATVGVLAAICALRVPTA